MTPRRYPITPRNSTVLGYDARGAGWRNWWATADWRNAIPIDFGRVVRDTDPCINVPCGDGYHDSWGPPADRPWYRVRPKRRGHGRAVLVGQVWHWEYHVD